MTPGSPFSGLKSEASSSTKHASLELADASLLQCVGGSESQLSGMQMLSPYTNHMCHSPTMGKRTRGSLAELPHFKGIASDPRVTNTPGVVTKHECVRRLIVTPGWLTVQVLAIFLDILNILCPQIQHSGRCDPSSMFMRTARGFILLAYAGDLSLRVYAFGGGFFRKTRNVIDFIIIAVSLSLTACRETGMWLPRDGHVGVHLLVAVRLLRVTRVVLMLSHAMKQCMKSMRRITSTNKARLVDPVNDIDLDLVYITPRLLAMSVPVNGWLTSLYRNPLSEVVEFFEKEHAGHYMIVNVCPECPYPEKQFRTGQIVHYNVTDHMPPNSASLLDFLSRADAFLARHPKNVLAVHCRGGKGRTGVFCAMWLFYDTQIDIELAMDKFAFQRTDVNPMAGDAFLQGIETPSQVRFCRDMARMLKQLQVFRPRLLQTLPSIPLQLLRLEASDVFLTPNVGELVLVVQQCGTTILVSQPGVSSWSLENVRIDGDFRISVAELGRTTDWGKMSKAGKEPGCLFYFVAHTALLEGTQLQLPISMVDKACKKRKLFNQEGVLTLTFLRECIEPTVEH